MSEAHYTFVDAASAHRAVGTGADAQLVDVREVTETAAVRV